MSLDVLYLTWNRREFTEVSLRTVFENTAWDDVDRLVVYDDLSEDGTADHVLAALKECPVPSVLRAGKLGSPVAVMRDYITRDPAAYFAKIDNDIAVPPGWLEAMQASFVGVDALGMAAGWTGITDGEPSRQMASHIGGVGVLRTDKLYPDELHGAGRYGWTEYQHAHARYRSAWVVPDVCAVELGKIPDEPWRTLTERYRDRGWERWWPPYDEASREWWAWIPEPNGA